VIEFIPGFGIVMAGGIREIAKKVWLRVRRLKSSRQSMAEIRMSYAHNCHAWAVCRCTRENGHEMALVGGRAYDLK